MNKSPEANLSLVTKRKVHPEQREDEHFLGNFDQAGITQKSEEWGFIRIGETAYDKTGAPYPEKMLKCYRPRPVFVKRKEALEKPRYGIHLPRQVAVLKLVK